MGSLRPSNVFLLKIELFSSKFVSEEFFSYDSQGFSFDKSFFKVWRVTRGEMCVQEDSSLFKMGLCIKDRFFS